MQIKGRIKESRSVKDDKKKTPDQRNQEQIKRLRAVKRIKRFT